MTPRQFTKIALSLPDVVLSEHHGHPDFRFQGKVFASLGYPDENWGMVKLTPDQQAIFIREWPDVFQPCTGAWGRSGCTNVRLASAKTTEVRSAQSLAVENLCAVLSKKRVAASPARTKRSSKKTT